MKDNMGNKLVYFVSLGKISVSPKIEKTLKIEPKSEFSGLSLRTGHYYFLKLGINLKDNMGNELVYFVSMGKISVPPKSEKTFKIKSKSWIFK